MEPPNPYQPPQAPVDPHPDSPSMHSTRMLLRVLAVAQLALIPLTVALPDTLPPELRALRDAREVAFLNAYAGIAMVSVALLTASLFGLWWEKRWAVWVYLAANAIGYALQLVSGVRIASDLASFVDSLADAAVGATLIVLYLGGYLSGRAADGHDPR